LLPSPILQVTCTVTDSSGKTVMATFVVRVRGPPGQDDKEQDTPMDSSEEDDSEDDSNGNGR
jgi:hypothetical protein